jgi:hypothetical protein
VILWLATGYIYGTASGDAPRRRPALHVAAFRDEKKIALARSLYNDKNNSIADIC